MSIFVITSNQGKFVELQQLIPDVVQKDIDLPELQEIDPQKIIQSKLAEALHHVDGPCIVEDTALYFDALHGLPGPLIKWFLKSLGTEGLADLASKLNNNQASAKTVLGYADQQGTTYFTEGEIRGTIVSPRGTNGFGWDPIFQPEGTDKTFAEMTTAEKHYYSMRRLAAQNLHSLLTNNEQPTTNNQQL